MLLREDDFEVRNEAVREELCALSDEPAAFADVADLEGRETTTWYQGVDAVTYRGKKTPNIKGRGRKAPPLPMVSLDPPPAFEQFVHERFWRCGYDVDLGLPARKLLVEIEIESPTPEHIRIATDYLGSELFGSLWDHEEISRVTPEYHEFHAAMRAHGIVTPSPVGCSPVKERSSSKRPAISPAQRELLRRHLSR